MAANATRKVLPLTVQQQQQTEWCWAAVSVSTDTFFRPKSTTTQCELVSSRLNRTCCVSGTGAVPLQCNQPQPPDQPLRSLHLLDRVVPSGQPTPAFTEVRKSIDEGCPICVLIQWTGKPSSGHVILLTGYRVTPQNQQFVSIEDPFYGSSEVDFTVFSNPAGGYRHGTGIWSATLFLADRGPAA